MIAVAGGSALAGFLAGVLLTGGVQKAAVATAPTPAERVMETRSAADGDTGVDAGMEVAAPTDKKDAPALPPAPQGIDPEVWAAMGEILEELGSFREQIVRDELRRNQRQVEQMALRLGLNEHQKEWLLELMNKNSLQPYGELLDRIDQALADPEATRLEMAKRLMEVKAQRETEGKGDPVDLVAGDGSAMG
ncbi:MAG: hypothetical protein HC901_02310 [Bdellovibrionaceae bacterium]|nr:hypothetical protein [Pseudobdellovibrionaceae bacterium]